MRLGAWAGRILAVVAIGSYPWLTHAALTGSSRWTRWAALLVALEMLALGTVFVVRSNARHRWAYAIVGLLALAASWQSAHDSLVAVSGIPHALINLGLLTLFGSSLAPGREALVTSIARRIDRNFPLEMVGYTRSVTAAWTIFFAAQLVVSFILFVAAPVSVWSLFVNVLNAPLIALMFLGEYGYRLLHFRNYRHASIPEMIRAFTQRSSSHHPTPLDQG